MPQHLRSIWATADVSITDEEYVPPSVRTPTQRSLHNSPAPAM